MELYYFGLILPKYSIPWFLVVFYCHTRVGRSGNNKNPANGLIRCGTRIRGRIEVVVLVRIWEAQTHTTHAIDDPSRAL